MLNRRSLIGSLLAAPVIIKTSGLLMPIKPKRFKMLSPGVFISEWDVSTYIKSNTPKFIVPTPRMVKPNYELIYPDFTKALA